MLRHPILLCLFLSAWISSCGKSSGDKTRPTPPAPAAQPVNTPLTVETSQDLKLVAAGSAVSLELQAVGTADENSLQWSLTGDYPEGMTLTYKGRKAELKGQASRPGIYDFTVTAADQKEHTARINFKVEVRPQTLGISTPLLINAKEGQPYRADILVTGGDERSYTWTVSKSGRDPYWLKTEAQKNKLLLSGTPVEPGIYDLNLEVEDASGQVLKKAYVLAVDSVLNLAALPLPGVVERPYETALDVTGGKGNGLTFTLVNGSLPKGLTLERNPAAARALIRGTPSEAGRSQVTIQVTDGFNGLATIKLDFALQPKLQFETLDLPDAQLAVDYSATIKVIGSLDQELVWNVDESRLNGLRATYARGKRELTLSGRPWDLIHASIWVEVKDAHNVSIAKYFSIRTLPNPPKILTPTLPATLALEAEQSISLEASSSVGQPFTWSVEKGVLPTGLWIQSDPQPWIEKATLVGKAFVPGDYAFTLKFSDAKGSTTQSYRMKVEASAPQFELLAKTLPMAVAHGYYGTRIRSRHGAIKSWHITQGQLPEGFILDQVTGTDLRVHGQTSQAGFFPFRIRVESESGETSETSYQIAVSHPSRWFSTFMNDSHFLVNELDLTQRVKLDVKPRSGSWSTTSPDLRWHIYSTQGSADADTTLNMVDLTDVAGPHTPVLTKIRFGQALWSPDSSRVALITKNGQLNTLNIYDVVAKKLLLSTSLSRWGFVWTPDGKNLAYCSGEKELTMLGFAGDAVTRTPSKLRNTCQPTHVTPGGVYLLNSEGGILRLKNQLVDAEGLLPGPLDWDIRPALSGYYILRDSETTRKLLDLSTTTLQETVPVPWKAESQFRFSKDETHLLRVTYNGNNDRTITLTDLNSPQGLQWAELGSAFRYPMSWSQDGQNFLAETGDGIVEYDLATLKKTKIPHTPKEFPYFTFQKTAKDRSIAFIQLESDTLMLVIKSLTHPDHAARQWPLGPGDATSWTRLTLDDRNEFLFVSANGSWYLPYGEDEAVPIQAEGLGFSNFLGR